LSKGIKGNTDEDLEEKNNKAGKIIHKFQLKERVFQQEARVFIRDNIDIGEVVMYKKIIHEIIDIMTVVFKTAWFIISLIISVFIIWFSWRLIKVLYHWFDKVLR